MRRIIDFIVAIVLLPFVLLVVAVLSAAIFVIDKYSPFHTQKRVGRGGRLFVCYKLQTMKPAKSHSLIGEREKDSERVTRLGLIIRDHGWDELPQLLNVLLGKMSFIGPRSLLPKTIDRIRIKNPEIANEIVEWERLREQVRPGISGWHQIHIREHASMLRCDLEQLQNHSVTRDLKVLAITTLVFFFGKSRGKDVLNKIASVRA